MHIHTYTWYIIIHTCIYSHVHIKMMRFLFIFFQKIAVHKTLKMNYNHFSYLNDVLAPTEIRHLQVNMFWLNVFFYTGTTIKAYFYSNNWNVLLKINSCLYSHLALFLTHCKGLIYISLIIILHFVMVAHKLKSYSDTLSQCLE